MLKKLAVVGLAVGAFALSAPSVAVASPVVSAESDSYTKPPKVSVDDPIIDTCEASTIAFDPGYFLPSEKLSVSVSGVRAEDARLSGDTAAADGSLLVSFRPPKDGEGSYAVTFAGSRDAGGGSAVDPTPGSPTVGAISAATYTATITVSEGRDAPESCDEPVVAAGGTELPLTGGTELALTGGEVSPWVVGGGAAALVAGGVLVAVGVSRRKRA